jgi:hypothetical protein
MIASGTYVVKKRKKKSKHYFQHPEEFEEQKDKNS